MSLRITCQSMSDTLMIPRLHQQPCSKEVEKQNPKILFLCHHKRKKDYIDEQFIFRAKKHNFIKTLIPRY